MLIHLGIRLRGHRNVGAMVFDRIIRNLFPARRTPAAREGGLDGPSVIIDYDDRRIPGPARDRVRMILATLLEVEAALKREGVPNFSGIDVARMRDIHLPRLLQSYIDIPSAHRSEIFRRTGKSASFVLVDSLDQMLRHLQHTLGDFAKHDIDAFTTNIRFIAQKFSDGAQPFD